MRKFNLCQISASILTWATRRRVHLRMLHTSIIFIHYGNKGKIILYEVCLKSKNTFFSSLFGLVDLCFCACVRHVVALSPILFPSVCRTTAVTIVAGSRAWGFALLFLNMI